MCALASRKGRSALSSLLVQSAPVPLPDQKDDSAFRPEPSQLVKSLSSESVQGHPGSAGREEDTLAEPEIPGLWNKDHELHQVPALMLLRPCRWPPGCLSTHLRLPSVLPAPGPWLWPGPRLLLCGSSPPPSCLPPPSRSLPRPPAQSLPGTHVHATTTIANFPQPRWAPTHARTRSGDARAGGFLISFCLVFGKRVSRKRRKFTTFSDNLFQGTLAVQGAGHPDSKGADTAP